MRRTMSTLGKSSCQVTLIGVALVVLEADVILGLVALDQVAFEDQGLQFRGSHDKVDVGDAGDEALGLGALPG